VRVHAAVNETIIITCYRRRFSWIFFAFSLAVVFSETRVTTSAVACLLINDNQSARNIFYLRHGGNVLLGVYMSVCLLVCLFVCLLATSHKNY